MGEGVSFGNSDSNIENGIPVDVACEDLIKAIYLRKHWITLGSTYFQVVPRIQILIGETIVKKLSCDNFKQ